MITEKARLLLDIWPRWFDEPKGSITAKHSLFLDIMPLRAGIAVRAAYLLL